MASTLRIGSVLLGFALVPVFACGGDDDASGTGTGAGAAAATGSSAATGAGGGAASFAFTHIAAGDEHNACAAFVNPDGLVCWNTSYSVATPALVEGIGRVTSLSMSIAHRCLVTGGVVSCWGNGEAGQLGPGGDAATPRAIAGLPGEVTVVSAGGYHTVALVGEEVWWWGGLGQLPIDFPDPPGETPVRYTGLPAGTVQAVAAGGLHTCALVDGAVYCWGANSYGQLGQGHADPVAGAVLVGGIPGPVTALAANVAHTCALTGGDVYCWGRNMLGEIGTGMLGGQEPTPHHVDGITGVTDIAAGAAATCALVDGHVDYWGGFGALPYEPSPTELPDTAGATLVTHGIYEGCAVVAGTVACWGMTTDPAPLEGFDFGLGGGGGAGGGSPTNDPYGPCTSAGDCPVAGSTCAGSSGGCLPPCGVAADCPAPPGGGFSAECIGGRCAFSCSVQAPACPGAMVCLAGTSCGYP